MHTLYIPKQYVFLDIFSTDIENNIQKKTNKKYERKTNCINQELNYRKEI